MCRSKRAWMVLALLLAMAGSSGAAERLGLGQPLSDTQLARWNIDVDAQGRGLPAGRGSVAQGQRIYAQTCAACHGDKGQGNPADPLVGGHGSLATAKPLKTIGSFWPYATTVFDFINRANAADANGVLQRNVILENHLKIVDQAGIATTVGLWGNNYAEGNIGYLKSVAYGDRIGGTLRLTFPLNSKIALTAEGGVSTLSGQ